ncbi:hypothetical protein [Paenibacillus sp. NPDC093718]
MAWQPSSTRGSMRCVASSGKKSRIQTNLTPPAAGSSCMDAL